MHLSCYLIDWIIVVFCVIQVAALQKNIASQTVGAPAFLLHLNALSDDLEARSPRREQAGRCRGESGDARRIVSEVEIETADLRLGRRGEVQGDGVRFVLKTLPRLVKFSPLSPLA